jgi:hypothetical protein
VSLVHLPKPQTPKGVPTHLEVYEEAHVMWRSAELGGLFLAPGERVEVDLEGPLFQGEVRGALEAARFLAWGLPEWRRLVGPQGFQDVDAPTLVRWIAAQVGGRVQVQLPQVQRRHYALPRAPAFHALRMVLSSFAPEAVAHELDGGVLYVGPLEGSPHRSRLHRLREEVARVRPLGGTTYLRTAPLPGLRLYQRVRYPSRIVFREGERLYEAPEGEGTVVAHRLVLRPEAAYHEVWLR